MVPQHSTVEAGPEIYVEHNDVLVLPMSNGISGCLGDNVNDKHSIGSIVTGNSNALFNGKEDSSSVYPDRMHCTPTFGNDSSTSAVSISDGRGLRGLPINLGTVYMTGVTRTPTLKASTKKRAISATRHSSRIAKPCADSIENESSLSNKERRSSLGDISDATNGKSVSTPKNGNSGDDPVPQPSASSSSGFKTIEADSTTPLEGNGDSSNISGNDDLANSSKKTVATAVPSAVNVLNGNGISSQHPNTTAKHSTGPVNATMPVTPIVHQGFVQPTNPIIDGSTGFYPIPVNPFSSNAQSSVGASNFQWGYIPGPNGGLSLVPYSVVGSPSMMPSMPIGVTGTNTTDVGHELQQPSTQGPLSLDRYQNGQIASRGSRCSSRSVRESSRDRRIGDFCHSRDSGHGSPRSRQDHISVASSQHSSCCSRASESSRDKGSSSSRHSSRPPRKTSKNESSNGSRHSRRREDSKRSQGSKSSTSSRRSSLLSGDGEPPRRSPSNVPKTGLADGFVPTSAQGGLYGSRFYQPPNRAPPSYGAICPGCGSQPCRAKISTKEFEAARSIAEKKPLKPIFKGEGDSRSGSTIVREIDFVLEGHDAVTRYLWANSNIEPSTWRKLIKGTQPPAKCYLDYEKHLARLQRQLRSFYDDEDSIAKAKISFFMCEQGTSESLSDYVKRLESTVTELHLMGIMTYEYDMKRRLYDGLQADYLRDKVDRELGDSTITFDEFVRLLTGYERRRLGRVRRQALYNQVANTYSKSSNESGKTTKADKNPKSRGYPNPNSQKVNTVVGDVDDDSNLDAHVYAVGADSMSIQCYRCTGVGHPARLCRGKVSNLSSRCNKCGNSNHVTDQCNVPDKSLYCQRCRKKGHLAYVCRADKPVDGISKPAKKNNKKSSEVQVESKKKPVKDEPSTPTPNAKVTNPKTKAHLVSREDAESYLRVSTLEGSDSQCSKCRRITNCSLYTASSNNKELRFDDPSALGHINVANGSTLSVLGKVELEVGYGSTFVKDSFLLASNELSTPVIIGCSTMAKLRTTISLSPEGIQVIIGGSTGSSKVNALDLLDGRLSVKEMDWARKVMVMQVSHYSKVVPSLRDLTVKSSLTIESLAKANSLSGPIGLYQDLYHES
ncbi:hypothetical protein Pmar_PMAR001085 [Perkinsus marinus ATCC 50983]|uniref:CCHC-type domain-containing protein n=1 Tax=Perkinsus marinus (strain ATCC 50983 / TXsc) TaxID=423536 RepID=C5KST8_PERM5|nr:hypothetical protein Pmar_PMAR001085 [Perkinsus marinus ATCC 50983]EER12288.1 hypothetical protein Pmar_PMAR001085 [Perkinsus marinus ATCC 50983]|eukprot:XP_002780493.1 hypothetical protein Pmar_PMAR001085 [Perkinsus marinus ATCC 50983]